MGEYTFVEGDLLYFHKAENTSGTTNFRHYHSTYEIYFMKDGECGYFIDDHTYDIKRGDIVLIPSSIIHKTNYADGTHTRLLLNCSESYVPESVRPILSHSAHIYRNQRISSECERILERIRAEYEGVDPFRREAITALVSELFILLARNTDKEVSDRDGGSVFVERTVKYVQNNYMNDITLGDAARLESISCEHLSRSFRRETGFGFSEYLALVRLKHAEDMLLNEPGKSISDVAFATGFNDGNYFSLKFKRAYGVSPSEYRRQNSNATHSEKASATI